MQKLFPTRLASLRKVCAAHGLDALVVTTPHDWYYLTGFGGEAGALVVGRSGATLITDGRFVTQAKGETSGVRIVQHQAGLYRAVGEFLRGAKWRRVGFDPAQLTVAQHKAIRGAAGARCALKPASGLILGLRVRKDSQELAQMRKAAILASEVVEHAIGLLKPGVRELDVAAEIEFQMRKLGALGPA